MTETVPVLVPGYTECHSLDWEPDLDNARLKVASLGLGSLATTPRPPKTPPAVDRPMGTPSTPYRPQ